MNSRKRVVFLTILTCVLAALFVAQVAIASFGTSANASVNQSEKPTPGNTLISIQSYGNYGSILEVTPEGETVWEYTPPNSRVFDAEVLDNGNILAAVATKRVAANCPNRELQISEQSCVQNRVVEIDYRSKNIVWNYTWYDEYIENHEVHDADRLKNGNTAIVDMGNDRAFVVNRDGNITWEWKADKHLSNNSRFRKQYGGPPNPGGEKDWTHINDIDRLDDGDYQLSIRNFDSIIDVDPQTHNITNVVGEPGNHTSLYEQHNPDRIESAGTTVIADSQNNRIVEMGAQNGSIIWRYGGGGLLSWPRDADRLPSGNTLITDTQNDRVIEINQQGEVVWEYTGADFAYNADRIGVGEDPNRISSARNFQTKTSNNTVTGTILTVRSYSQFVIPRWMNIYQATNLLVLIITGMGLILELSRYKWSSK